MIYINQSLMFRIALRYLFARKSHTAVNIISIVSVAGVAVATAAIVVVLSVFNGFSDLGHSQLSVLDPDLLLTPAEGKVIEQADSLAAVISLIPGIRAAEPVLQERGLLISSSGQTPVRFKGVSDNYRRAVPIDSVVSEGEFYVDSVLDRPTANIAIGVAYHAGITPGTDRSVRLYVPRRVGRINPANPAAAYRGDTLLVWSILRSDIQEFDADCMVISLATARHLLDYDHQASALEIALTDGADAARVKEQLRRQFPGLTVADRLEQQAEAFRMIAIEKWMTFLMLVFILVIATFNVISTLSLLVVEKSDDAFTFRAMGASRGQVRSIFIWQGWLITMLGGLAGIILGTGLTLLQQFCHVIKLHADASALTIDYYPVRLAPADLLIVTAVIAVIALLTAQTTRLLGKKQ